MRLAVILACAGLSLASPLPAHAQGAGEAANGCASALSPPMREKWMALGGAQGRLGCPTGAERATVASSQGSTGDEVILGGANPGALLRHRSGPQAGQVFVVEDCFWRLYFQFGGSSGWLGFPTSDAENTPDGKRQAFEGGEIVYQRAPDTCLAHRADELASAPLPGPTSRLDLFEDAQGRRMAIASAAATARARDEGYRPVAILAFVFDQPAPDVTPLKTYWNRATGDHDTIASPDSERADLAAGYEFDGQQGFVWVHPRPGGVPLKRFWNPQTKMSLLTSDAAAEAQAVAAGYQFVRIEGYASAGPQAAPSN
jgi:hypothetical protein